MPETSNFKLRTVPAPPIVSAAGGEYAELDVASNFSFLRGASHPDELVYRAAELGYRAIAITDLNSLAGVVRAHDAARQVSEQGGAAPKLIIGARLSFEDAPDLLTWATDRAAYARLCRLLTLGKRRAEKGDCALGVRDFVAHSDGLLAAACLPAVPSDPQQLESRAVLSLLRESLGQRLSLASSCLYRDDHAVHLDALLRVSRSFGIPPLATNHVHYHMPDRRRLQDVLVCVREGCTIHNAGYRLFPNAERHLKSPAQMARLFADHPQAIRRGLEIAEQCAFSLDELRYEYPDEVVPPGRRAIEHLADLAWRGAAERYPAGVPDKVRRLIEHELRLIEQLKYEAYFLTVYDLVRFARSRGILCQGRGSAANSAVCYCIGVTSVDPSRIDLLFERFVSAARDEPPDIDVDFEHERREEVLQYIYEKYGRERAGMTAEVITYRGRSAVRDVGKALGLSLDLVDQMAGKLDWWHRGTLQEEQIRELGLNPADPTVCRVIDLTGQLLGFPRHLSQHVGGMVMTRGPLCELVPIENASMPNRTVIEWDKDDIDALGILKVDVLGLGMLTCISKALGMINGGEGKARSDVGAVSAAVGTVPAAETAPTKSPLQLHTVPPEDPAVYQMISNADTIGVFQIESRAQMSMLPRLRPKEFYDLVIEVAIVRPGPIQGNMVHPYLRRRNGEEPVTYPSEALREVLGKTLGVPLFQEQAMRVAMVGAGFSADEADRLRRAMAAWRKHGAIDQFRQKIIDGMLKNGYTAEFAEQCFLQIRGFGEYGFPESHAASFALLVYVSAWIKHYYPAHFAAALLNSQPMGFYAPAQIVRDAQAHGVEVRGVDVNGSEWDNVLESGMGGPPMSPCSGVLPPSPGTPGEGRGEGPSSLASYPLRLGFRQIKGLRQAHLDHLIAVRNAGGPFTSIADLHLRTGLRRTVLERLAEADAFSSLGLSRRQALWRVLELSDEQYPLFAHLDRLPPADDAQLPAMPLGQEVLTDYRTAGLSLKSHPVALVRDELEKLQIISARQLHDLSHGHWARVAGLVLIRQRPGTASGVLFVTLEDETGIVNLIVRPDIYDRFRPAARTASLLHAEGYVERQGQVIHLMTWRMFDQSHLLHDARFKSRDFR